MLSISKQDIINRMKVDNPWWDDLEKVSEAKWPQRNYFGRFYDLVTNTSFRRATILMGPRRVGKTVMIRQTIVSLIENRSIPKTHALF